MPRGKKPAASPSKKPVAKKGKATAKATSPSNALSGVMKATMALAKKNKIDVLNPEDFDEMMGVKFFISTGLPSLDLYLCQNNENFEDGDLPYGFPTGRIVEISGKENSYKSWLLHSAAAQTRKMGGLIFQVYTEADFDIEFFKYFYDKKGLDFKKDVEPYIGMSPATTVDDVKHAVSTFITSVKAYYDAGGTPIPAIITIDSLGALLSETNLVRMDKDEDDQVGVHAKDLHNFFKRVKNDCARYNILLMFTNHNRAALGGAFAGETSAHDSAVKYYAALRLNLSADKTGDKSSSFGMDFLKNRKVRCNIKKIKGTMVGNGKFELLALPNIGFDYLGSLLEAARITQILVRKGNGSYEFRGEAGQNKYLDELISELGTTTVWSGGESLRKYLKEHMKAIVLLEKACYVKGPHLLSEEDVITTGDDDLEQIETDMFEDFETALDS
jgi:RecA/RadA recombinase